MRIKLPVEFDAIEYRERHHDLSKFNEDQLLQHYQKYGINEGRCPSVVASRDDFISLIECDLPALEIGPFVGPCLTRPNHNVEYFDVLNREEMIARAQMILDSSEVKETYFSEGIKNAREIKYVHKTGDLTSVSDTFSSVFSSHCIEHQVDIIKHLNDVFDLLEPGGRYFVVAPDKRYCFDHFHPESRFIDALAAHLEGRQFHTTNKVLEHLLMCTHNDPVLHWSGDHGAPRIDTNFFTRTVGAYDNAMHAAKLTKTEYVDVHNWIFTPDSFRDVMRRLFEGDLIKMPLVRVYPTILNSMEFYAVFEKQT